MGFGIKELVIILVIVLLLFGTKKLSSLGSDLGSAIKGFRKSVSDDKDGDDESDVTQTAEQKREAAEQENSKP